MTGKAPRTILGIVVAAVARRLVPNCSAPIVTKIAQNPVLKPRAPHTRYILELLLLPLRGQLEGFSTASLGCIDDDTPEDQGPEKSGEDDPDFMQPGEEDTDPPECAPANLQDDEDDGPCAPPKP